MFDLKSCCHNNNHNLIITKADKDNTFVVIPKDTYMQKVDNFILQYNCIIKRPNKAILRYN